MANPGDKVEIKTNTQVEEGILMPDPDENTIIIKLSTGYNIGFERKDVLSVKLVEEKKEKKTKEKEVEKKKGLKTIAVLHTGGTIASKVDYETGGVTAQFSAADLIELVPELGEIANIETDLVANMMSEDMSFADYQKIAAAVEKWAGKVEGIIIGHGTDTLGYTAAALAFMLEELGIPVLIVGSQRSPDRGSADAAMNLICAAEFIVKSDFAGVATCLHHSSNDDQCAILPACKARKLHTSRRDAFRAVNDTPIALINYKTRKIKFVKKDHVKKSKSKVVVKDKFELETGLMKTHPGMSLKLFKFFAQNYKGFVIEGTGLGHAPTNQGENLRNYEILKEYIHNGGIIAITSQCIFGAVHPHVYTNLRRLSEIGCIFCKDILPEVAFIKLAWLMGNYPDQVKEMMVKNLRGEINESLKYEEEFVK